MDVYKDLEFSFQTVKESVGTIIIEPIGSINSYNSIYFEERINLLIDQGYTQLVFDMSNIKYISAMGIGSLINLLNRVKESDGSIVLDRLQPHVLEVFQLPGFSGVFKINLDIGSADIVCDDEEVFLG